MRKEAIGPYKHFQVIFLGSVGVGKSTQLSLLQSYFRHNNVSVSRCFLKSFYPHMLRTIARFGHKMFDERDDGSVVVTLDPSVAKRIMKGMLVIDVAAVLTAYLLTIKLPLYFKDVILVEESLPGTIMEYMDAAWKGVVDTSFAVRLIKFLLLIIYKEQPLMIILVTKREVLRERWVRRQSPFETERYLESQNRVIQSIIKFHERKIVVYDDGNTVKEIHDTIVDEIQNANFK